MDLEANSPNSVENKWAFIAALSYNVNLKRQPSATFHLEFHYHGTIPTSKKSSKYENI